MVHVVLLWGCEGSREEEKGEVLVQVLHSQHNWLQEQASLLWALLKWFPLQGAVIMYQTHRKSDA